MRARSAAACPPGFTLPEMLVVLIIIGLIASLVGPQLMGRVDTSKVTTADTQVRMLKSALDTMRLDIGRYPTKEEGLALLVVPPKDDRTAPEMAGALSLGRQSAPGPVGKPLSSTTPSPVRPMSTFIVLAPTANRAATASMRMSASFPRQQIRQNRRSRRSRGALSPNGTGRV